MHATDENENDSSKSAYVYVPDCAAEGACVAQSRLNCATGEENEEDEDHEYDANEEEGMEICQNRAVHRSDHAVGNQEGLVIHDVTKGLWEDQRKLQPRHLAVDEKTWVMTQVLRSEFC